ncbi:hypothetical protein FWH13_03980 [Candidatus Saccharibacteria bacterium]|nr:hypothetical protein [Candidatus Saccharibacteria bacterium]
MTDANLLMMLAGVFAFGALVFVLISVAKYRVVLLDKEKFQAEFLRLENGLDRLDSNTYRLSVIDADKLLDEALKEMHVKGETLGERLKMARGKFSNINAVWAAHRLRNQIVHERGTKVTYDQAKRALAAFRRALQDLGAI